MTHYFTNKAPDTPAWASKTDEERVEMIKDLHKLKTAMFLEAVEAGELALRPGVRRLVAEAFEAGVKVAVCSTSNEKAVAGIVRLLGPDYADNIPIFAGDVVPRKKPDPAVYTLAAETLDVSPSRCVVVEDSNIGACVRACEECTPVAELASDGGRLHGARGPRCRLLTPNACVTRSHSRLRTCAIPPAPPPLAPAQACAQQRPPACAAW